ncbi:hypothetical protein NN561_008629 [Cricetulus griseus]
MRAGPSWGAQRQGELGRWGLKRGSDPQVLPGPKSFSRGQSTTRPGHWVPRGATGAGFAASREFEPLALLWHPPRRGLGRPLALALRPSGVWGSAARLPPPRPVVEALPGEGGSPAPSTRPSPTFCVSGRLSACFI